MYQLLPARSKIQFHDTKSDLPGNNPPAPSGGNTTPEYVLLSGHHLIVVAEGKAILDHQFGGKTTPASQSNPTSIPSDSSKALSARSGITGVKLVSAPATQVSATDEDSGATMGATKKSFPGLPITIISVSRNNAWKWHYLIRIQFGVQVKDDHIFIIIDAKVNPLVCNTRCPS